MVEQFNPESLLHPAVVQSPHESEDFSLPITLKPLEAKLLPDESLRLIETKHSGDPEGKYPERQHHLVEAVIDGRKHIFWHTAPLEQDDEMVTVFVKPGLGEVVESGIGWKHHKQMARKMPGAEVISHATHGVGPHGEEIGLGGLWNHGVSQMAEDEAKLLHKFWQGANLLLVGISMGTVENHRVAHANIDAKDPLNIAGVVNYAPALVDPKQIIRDLCFRFTPAMARDGIEELLLRTHPLHYIGTIGMLLASRPRRRDALVMARQSLSILAGTPEEEVRDVASAYPSATVVGDRDPAGQLLMWQGIEKDIDDFVLRPVRGGHGIAVKPLQGANKTSKTIREMGFHVGPAELKSV